MLVRAPLSSNEQMHRLKVWERWKSFDSYGRRSLNSHVRALQLTEERFDVLSMPSDIIPFFFFRTQPRRRKHLRSLWGTHPQKDPAVIPKFCLTKFPKLPLNLSTGKVSHWKAKKIWLQNQLR